MFICEAIFVRLVSPDINCSLGQVGDVPHGGIVDRGAGHIYIYIHIYICIHIRIYKHIYEGGGNTSMGDLLVDVRQEHVPHRPDCHPRCDLLSCAHIFSAKP